MWRWARMSAEEVLIKGVLVTRENVDPVIQLARRTRSPRSRSSPSSKPLPEIVATRYMKTPAA